MGRATSALLVATVLLGAWRLNTAKKQRRAAPREHFARPTSVSTIEFVVLYGDIVLNVDLERMWSTHVAREADATLFVHPNDHPYDSDIVETDLSDWIVALHPYPHPQERDLPNLVNAGLYVVEKRCLERRSPRSMEFLILPSNLFRSCCMTASI